MVQDTTVLVEQAATEARQIYRQKRNQCPGKAGLVEQAAVAAVAAVIRAVQFHRQTGLELVAAAVPEAQEVRLATAALSCIIPNPRRAAWAVRSETKTISCFWTNSAVNWWCEVRICHITQANIAAKI